MPDSKVQPWKIKCDSYTVAIIKYFFLPDSKFEPENLNTMDTMWTLKEAYKKYNALTAKRPLLYCY